MAVDITGGDGSLFWKAGIDDSGFDEAMNRITDKIQQQVKTQINVQQQAAQSQKQIAQTILQNAGILEGFDKNIEAQVKNLSALQGQIQTLKGQTVDLSAKGFDTTQLTASLDAVLAEIKKIKSTPLDIQTGKVDVSPLLTALQSVETEFNKISGQSLQVKVGGINTESVEKAFANLQTKIDSLNQTAINLKVGGVDTASLTSAIEKAKQEFETLKGLTITGKADLDITEFQAQYDRLQKSLSLLESEKIELKTQGIDTTQLEKDITAIKTQAASLSRQTLKVNVDESSLVSLEKHIETLQARSFELKAKGIDTTELDAALLKIQAKVDKIKNEPVELKAGTVNLAPLSTALTGLQKQVKDLGTEGGLQPFAEKQVSALSSVNQALDQSEKELREYFQALDSFKNEGVEVKVNQRAPDSQSNNTRQVVSPALDDSSLKTLEQAKQVFREMDQETQAFIKELVELEGQLEEVKKAQKNLDEERLKGNLTNKQYTDGTRALSAQEKNIADSISLIGKRQKEYEKSLEPVIEKTISAQTRLSQLKKEMSSNPGSPMFETWMQEAAELQIGINKVNQELKNAVALQQLQRRKSELGGLLVTEQDTSKARAYKREISSIDIEIKKLSNAGKAGFDDLGNAIGKTTAKGNLLTKAFGFIRQAALFIPGIGVAGIFSLISDTIVDLVANLFKGKQAFDAIGEKIKAFNEVNQAANRAAASQITDLKLLYKAATDVNAAMKDRVSAVKDLQSKFPDTFAMQRQEIILNGEAKQSYLDLIEAIQATSRAKAVRDKLDDIEAQRADIAFQKEKIRIATENEKAAAQPRTQDLPEGGFIVVASKEQVKKEIEQRRKAATEEQEIQDQRLKNQADFLIKYAGGAKKLIEIINGGEKKLIEGSVAAIDAEIANQKRLQSEQSTTDKKWQEYQANINKLEEQRKKIVGASKSEIKAADTEQNKALSKRLQLLKDIQALQRDATQSGLVKEQSELDKINEKYDIAIQKIKEFNASKAVKKGVVAAIDLEDVEVARQEEVRNFNLKQDAEKFKQNLEQQKQIFEQYEEAKKQIGIEKANEMFAEQRKGFTSYGEFLRNEFARQLPKISLGIGNIGDAEKAKALFKAIGDYQREQAKQQLEDQVELLQKTSNFSDQRALMDQKYQRLFKALSDERGKISEEEYDRRNRALIESQNTDEEALKNSFARMTELYKKLGQDLILKTKDELKKRLAELQKILSDGFTVDESGSQTLLTPQMKADLQNAVDQVKNLLLSTNSSAVSAGKVALEFNKAKSALSGASELAALFDKGLSDVLNTMTSIADAGLDIATAVGQFATGNIVGGIASAVSGVTKLIGSLFSNPAEKKRQEELLAFNQRVFAGEFAINELHRERARLALDQYTLTLQRIEKEKELLEQQKAQIEEDFKKVLNELQSQTGQVLGKRIVTAIGDATQEMNDKITQGLLDSGKTIEEIRAMFSDKSDMLINISLKGLSFDQLNEMFMKGQLEGKAKELVETLRGLEQQGIDVRRMIDDNNRATKEFFTGTTSDAIADSIIDGFSKGLKSAQDFAGTFEDLIKKAMLNSLKFKYLEAPLQKFFEEFADAADSNGGLSDTEVKQLNDKFNAIINAANAGFDQIQKLSGLDFSKLAGGNANSLQGAIKNIQEETASLIAGQLGAMRLNGVEILNVAMQQLERLNAIQFNTAATVQEIKAQTALLSSVIIGGQVKVVL